MTDGALPSFCQSARIDSLCICKRLNANNFPDFHPLLHGSCRDQLHLPRLLDTTPTNLPTSPVLASLLTLPIARTDAPSSFVAIESDPGVFTVLVHTRHTSLGSATSNPGHQTTSTPSTTWPPPSPEGNLISDEETKQARGRGRRIIESLVFQSVERQRLCAHGNLGRALEGEMGAGEGWEFTLGIEECLRCIPARL